MTKIINGIEIPKRTIYENLKILNQNNLHVPAIEFHGKQLNYKEFFNEIDKYAKAFLSMGVKKGSVVTLCMPQIPEFIICNYALNAIGAVANGVNINYLANNLKRYTDDKKSDTLVLFDKWYGIIHEHVNKTKLKNILLATVANYMPEEEQVKYKDQDFFSIYETKGMILPGSKDYVRMQEFINVGKKDTKEFECEKYDEERDSTYLYSSGTTGEPKCVVFKDYAVNSLHSMHKGVNTYPNDGVGDRSYLNIPLYYATSWLFATHLQLCQGKTLVLDEVYDKNTFAHQLRDLKINHTVAALSHYTTLINSDLKPGDLKDLRCPGSGGEGSPKRLAIQINEALNHFGCEERLVIGGGTSELGSIAFGAYGIPDRTNETGNAMPGVLVKIINPDTGREVKPGERGEMIVSTPNAMDRYYDDPEATDKYFSYDENGIRWGHPEDMGKQNKNNSFTMEGRKKDSYTNHKERVYLFDTEEKLSETPAILEVEAVALPINGSKEYAEVIHVVLNKKYENKPEKSIKQIYEYCKNNGLNVNGIKIISSFGTSPVSGKRNYSVLKFDRDDFYSINEEGQIIKISFPENSKPVIEPADRTEIKSEESMSLVLKR